MRDVAPQTYTLTVHIGFETYTVPADARETVLTAMERAGLNVPSKCRAGGCGFCHSKLAVSYTHLDVYKRQGSLR